MNKIFLFINFILSFSFTLFSQEELPDYYPDKDTAYTIKKKTDSTDDKLYYHNGFLNYGHLMLGFGSGYYNLLQGIIGFDNDGWRKNTDGYMTGFVLEYLFRKKGNFSFEIIYFNIYKAKIISCSNCESRSTYDIITILFKYYFGGNYIQNRYFLGFGCSNYGLLLNGGFEKDLSDNISIYLHLNCYSLIFLNSYSGAFGLKFRI